MDPAKSTPQGGTVGASPTLRPGAFQSLFPSLPKRLLVLRPDPPRFTILAVNEGHAHSQASGWKEILGRGLFEVLSAGPDDPEETGWRGLRASLERVIETRSPDVIWLQNHDRPAPRDGGRGSDDRWWAVVNSPLMGKDGELAYIIHSCESVSAPGNLDTLGIRQLTKDLRESEAMMKAVVETAVDAIITVDSQGTMLSVNPATRRMLGYGPEEALGRNVSLLMPSPQREEHDGYMAAYLRSGVKKIIGIGRMVMARRKDGSVFPAHLSVTEVQLAGRRLFTGFLRDLTQQKHLEAEYLQAQKMEAVGRLAGGVAHDFNNLLAGILGGIGIAARSLAESHPAAAVLREVEQEVSRGALITRHLLDFSRTDVRPSGPIDPHDTVRRAEPILRRLLGEDIEVQIDFRTDGSRVLAEHGRLEQALLNLAINARDAMPEGGRILVAARNTELAPEDLRRLGADARPGRYVVLAVEDTGSGMDQETLRKATEAFFTTKRPGMGTGLGLSTVESTVREWGGILELESAPGVGTKVRLYLPRVEAPAELGAAETGTPRAEEDGGSETILVVEDEKLVLRGIQHFLEELGYVVLTAARPDEALKLLRAQGSGVDLLLTDVVLPGLSGPDLAAEASTIAPGLSILFMSAFPQEELVARGRIEPGTPTLEKPFSSQDLSAKVRAVLAASGRSRRVKADGRPSLAPDRPVQARNQSTS